MIIESIEKVDKIMPYLSLRLSKALAYLRDTDFSKLADGKYEIEGKKIFASIDTYETQKRKDNKPEAHFKYIDIQYILSGKEAICYAANIKGKNAVEVEDKKTDLIFYKDSVKDERKYQLNAGQLMILFPWEIHRPKCKIGKNPEKVRKIVIKVLSEG